MCVEESVGMPTELLLLDGPACSLQTQSVRRSLRGGVAGKFCLEESYQLVLGILRHSLNSSMLVLLLSEQASEII